VGWAGVARPESGIRLIEACPGCGYKRYSGLQEVEQLIDWGQWSGEDFFMVWPLPKFRLVTRRVADVLEGLKVKSFSLGSLRRIEVRKAPAALQGSRGFAVGRLSAFMPQDIAVKYGGPLGLE
jgi:hypothetical protein